MKKFFCMIFIVASALFILLGCNDYKQHDDKITIESSATPETTTSPEPVSTYWYEKIVLNYLDNWSYPVIETDEFFYYCAKDGLYRYTKATENDLCIVSGDVSGLFMYEDTLYFNTRDTVKLIDCATCEVTTVWDKSMVKEAFAESYEYVNDFQVYEDYLYILINGVDTIRNNLKTGMTEMFLKDANNMVLSGDTCYYTDHSSRSFSVYRMDIDSRTTELLIGDGLYGSDENKQIYINALVRVTGDIYYFDSGQREIYMFTAEENNQFAFKVPEEKSFSMIAHAEGHNLQYTISGDSFTEIYEHTSLGENLLAKIDSVRYKGGITITDSAIFYMISEDLPVQCIIRE